MLSHIDFTRKHSDLTLENSDLQNKSSDAIRKHRWEQVIVIPVGNDKHDKIETTCQIEQNHPIYI